MTLFCPDVRPWQATASALSEGMKSELVGGRPFVSQDYAMFPGDPTWSMDDFGDEHALDSF